MRKVITHLLIVVFFMLGIVLYSTEVKAASYPSIMLKVPYYPQKASGDCGISSIAMIEAYALGYDKSHFDATYAAVLAANNNSYYINAACSNGRYIDIPMNLESFYSQLAAGKPILIRREPYEHWSVIVGYNGSSTNLEQSGFIVWDTKRGVSVGNYNEVTTGRTFSLARWLKAPNWNGSAYVDRGQTSLVRARVRGTGAISGTSSSGYTVINTGVTSITETTARINAKITPGATVTELGFYLGTSTDNMQKKVESGTTYAESIWYDLGTGKWSSALRPGTKYYYQIYAVIGGTTYKSTVDSFTTKASSVSSYTVTNSGVTSITETTARINAKLSPGATVTEVGFYLGTSPDNMQKKIESGTTYVEGIWYDLGTGKWSSALNRGTKYYYQIYAVIGGTTYKSAVDSFTTKGTSTSSYTVTNSGVSSVSDTSARINAKLSPGATVTEVGFFLGTTMDNMQKTVESGTTYVESIWYDLGTGKWSSALSRGTTYYYKIYAVIGGVTYTSAIDSFTTTGDGTAPVISNVQITNITNDGYTVSCDVTDNAGVARVCFPTWTDANGQDDIASDWYNTTAVHRPSSGNTYSFRVSASEHNSEGGAYTTHIYAYDMAGNHSMTPTGATIVKVYPLYDFSLNMTRLALQKGETKALSVTSYEPSNTTSDKTASWNSMDTSIAVVDANGKVTGKSVGTTMITCTVAGIVRQCEVVVTRSVPFTDVQQGAWYYDYVADVYEKGYMVGSGSTFKPNANLTRAEIVTTLYSVCGKPNTAFIGSFSDVKNGQWYSNPISWAYRNGIVSGYANGKFGVSDLITREQFAVMLYQYANTYNYNTAYNNNALAGYSDAGRVSSWASTAMKWAVSNGIISGKSNGILDPSGTATRAECATMIMKLTQL